MGNTDWTVDYYPGKNNVVADALSRIPKYTSNVQETTTDMSEKQEIFEVTRAITRAQAKKQQEPEDKGDEPKNESEIET